MHVTHRAQLLDDSFNLGRAEIIDQVMFLDFTKYLVKETENLAFIPAFAGFNFMTPFIEDEPDVLALYQVRIIHSLSELTCIILTNFAFLIQKYYQRILQPTYDRHGWNPNVEDVNDM